MVVAVRIVAADVPKSILSVKFPRTRNLSEIVIPFSRSKMGIRMLCGAQVRMVHLGSMISERAFSVLLQAQGTKTAETFL